MKKIIAICSALVLMFSFASCTSNKKSYKELSAKVDAVAENISKASDAVDAGTVPSSGDGVDEPDVEEELTEVVTDASGEAVTDANGEAKTEAPTKSNKTNTSKASKTDSKADIVNFYVTAAKKTDKNVTVTTYKTLSSLNGGEGGLGSIISKLEGVAKSALAKNSGTDTGVRGYLELIKVDDFSSATKKDDGTNTTVTLVVKDYDAPATGRKNEGSVGHAIGVLDTLDQALGEVPITVTDTSNVRLVYENAKIVAKINNKTGKITSAQWDYDVTVKIPDNKIKFTGIPLSLKGASLKIHYKAVL